MPAEPALALTIRRGRERKQWTQQQLADAVGVSLRSVSNWELGHHVPKNRLGALADVLGVSFDEPEAPLVAADEWEAAVLADRDLPDSVKRALIGDYRSARRAYEERRRDAGQATGRAS